MLGCYALMLGFREKPAMDWDAALIHNADISWISVNNSKPGRSDATSILVHSTNAFAEARIDADVGSVEKHLLGEFHTVTGIDTDSAEHRALHRWRYANMPQQSGEVALLDTENQLGACGDWLIRGRIEAAFTSAMQLAEPLRQNLQQAG
jgi:predicted NAD/FAD-dependent oxidoreductase